MAKSYKKSKSVTQYQQDVICQMTARYYATLFNQQLYQAGIVKVPGSLVGRMPECRERLDCKAVIILARVRRPQFECSGPKVIWNERENYEWDCEETLKIWHFAPPDSRITYGYLRKRTTKKNERKKRLLCCLERGQTTNLAL